MINVKYLKLPPKVKAVSTKNEDDTYTIILNSQLNHEQNLKSYIHEIKHIDGKDHYKNNVSKIEFKARKK